jgi:Mg-chelatase subunit ChlI
VEDSDEDLRDFPDGQTSEPEKEPYCFGCLTKGHEVLQCTAKEEKRKGNNHAPYEPRPVDKPSQRCKLCGIKGHVITSCPGLTDDTEKIEEEEKRIECEIERLMEARKLLQTGRVARQRFKDPRTTKDRKGLGLMTQDLAQDNENNSGEEQNSSGKSTPTEEASEGEEKRRGKKGSKCFMCNEKGHRRKQCP